MISFLPDEEKNTPAPNTDGLINCLRQPGLLHNQPQKSKRENSTQLIKICANRINPAAETKSIGLPADALVPCFLLTTWTISS